MREHTSLTGYVLTQLPDQYEPEVWDDEMDMDYYDLTPEEFIILNDANVRGVFWNA